MALLRLATKFDDPSLLLPPSNTTSGRRAGRWAWTRRNVFPHISVQGYILRHPFNHNPPFEGRRHQKLLGNHEEHLKKSCLRVMLVLFGPIVSISAHVLTAYLVFLTLNSLNYRSSNAGASIQFSNDGTAFQYNHGDTYSSDGRHQKLC